MTDKKLVRVHIAAAHFKVSTWTIRRWVEEGRLYGEKDPGGRCWLVSLEKKEVAAIVEEEPSKEQPSGPVGRRVISRGIQL